MVKKVGNLIPNTFLLQRVVATRIWKNMQVLITWPFMMLVYQTLTL